jgi:bifunctional non-homologous end joining protein LigD
VAGRSRYWVKSRHRSVLDLTVIGWARRGSGEVTLLLAEPTAEGLRYCGGCTAPGNLIEMLAPLEAAEPPIAVPAWSRKVHWVRPELQVEVRAASREPDGRLRHPRFERARPDQPPTA